MSRQDHLWVRVALAMLTCCLAVSAWAGDTQPVVGGQGFKFYEYYDAPNETHIKWLMECSQA